MFEMRFLKFTHLESPSNFLNNRADQSEACSLDVLLSELSESASFIASQSSGIANNYGAYGWGGSLATLEPGNGYLLNMDTQGEHMYLYLDI